MADNNEINIDIEKIVDEAMADFTVNVNKIISDSLSDCFDNIVPRAVAPWPYRVLGDVCGWTARWTDKLNAVCIRWGDGRDASLTRQSEVFRRARKAFYRGDGFGAKLILDELKEVE